MTKYGDDENFVLGHGYEVDVATETDKAKKSYETFLTILEKNKQRARLGKMPLSAAPHQYQAEEGKRFANAKEFTKFKRAKIAKQGSND